ncbi:nucleotidyltransferase domain-containing protein [Candidatus Woesearchaeota archaeon]|nr:nucleotidyltransferase domain-containing protein [Candidatus Woesearchaeota archaeon]
MKIKKPPRIEVCRKIAKEKVLEILKTRSDIIAAYSDGSVARKDMIPGSDIDIVFIVKNPNEQWHVYRTINKKYDLLIECVFISKKEYTNPKKILNDAGFTHDIKDAFIYHDPTGFFNKIQKKVKSNYKDKARVLRAARNQLKAMKKTLRDIESGINLGYNLRNFAKFAQAFPSAVLNTPLTNTRGLLWCEKASKKLGFPEYKDFVLEFLGSNNMSKNDAQKMLNLAKKILKSKELDKNHRTTILHHLRAPQYLIDAGYWQESVFKTLLWTAFTVDKLKSKVKEWEEMLDLIGWNKKQDIKQKIITGKRIISLSSKILKLNSYSTS